MTRIDIFDIDLWDNSAETVEKLHASGKKVICYFSAGTSEDWRVDFKNIRPQDMGASLPLWKGERWLDIRKRSVWTVMQKRIELASKRGCDAIDPDNIGMILITLFWIERANMMQMCTIMRRAVVSIVHSPNAIASSMFVNLLVRLDVMAFLLVLKIRAIF